MILSADIPLRLADDISHAKHSVHLQAMSFGTTGRMRSVTEALYAALERGVQVTLAFDRLSFLNTISPDVQQLRKDCIRLQDKGATINLLGKSLFPLPVAGRSHTKIYIIDDIAYFAGGVNLYDKAFDAHDFMLRMICDDQLIAPLQQVAERQPNDEDDWKVKIGDSSVLVDGGRRNHSLILESAAKLAATAKYAWYVSQYSPGRQLEAELTELPSDRSKAWFNVPMSSKGSDKLSAAIDMRLTKLANRYRGGKRIHAKYLVIQRPDSTYAAITGSNNFSDWGVRFGTKEAALYTTNQDICQWLIEFAESLD